MTDKENKEKKKEQVVEAPTRGRIFEGFVTKKFPKRVVVELERTIYVQKYERSYKKKSKFHARLPESLESQVKVGDFIKIRECRPLSKTIHFIVLNVLKKANAEETKEEKE